jgi:hypothetical protein
MLSRFSDDVFSLRKLPRASVDIARGDANSGRRGKPPELLMQEVKEPVRGWLIVGGDVLPDSD